MSARLYALAFFPAVLAAQSAVSSGIVVLTPAGDTLLVANPDSGSVSALDTGSRQKRWEIRVGDDPRSLAVSPNGRYLYVANQASASITVIDVAQASAVASLPVGAEPYGVVVDPGAERIYVASSAMDRVEVYSSYPALESLARWPTTARPKGLALTADGRRLYVTHFYSGEVSVINTSGGVVDAVISSGPDRNMAQKIILHPSGDRAYAPMIRSNVVNRFLLFDGAVFPIVSVIGTSSLETVPHERVELSLGIVAANLPVDLAFSRDGMRAYVVSLGSGDLSAVDLRSGYTTARVDVGDGPRGIAISPDGRTAYVANSLSDDVSIVDLERMVQTVRVQVTSSPLPPNVKQGKVAFFSSRSTATSRDRWMSCVSCHFDGEHDGRTWITSLGIRNTTSLRGVGETKPIHWSADRDEVQDFEFTIRELQAGFGLIPGNPNLPLGLPNAQRSASLDALAAFVESLRVKPSPFVADQDAISRGAEMFSRADVGCASCHAAPLYTDSGKAVHDIGSGNGRDEFLGPAFDTPSLRGVWDTAPYLHDGSAPTLRDVLVTRNPDDRHGRTAHLTETELADLIAFLRSL